MVSFDPIRDYLGDINYGCNLGTSLLLVPGLSLVIRTIKEARLEHNIIATYAPAGTFDYRNFDAVRNDRRLVVEISDIREAHILSGLVQLVLIVALLCFFGPALALYPPTEALLVCGGLSALYETFSSLLATSYVRVTVEGLSVGYSVF